MSNPIFNSVKLVQDFNRSSPSVAEQDDWNPPKSVLPHWRAKKRQHVRSNSFYAQRHFKKKWNKPRFLQLYSRDHLLKKQKLLCLWPLPTILGYTILLSLFISILSFINWYPVSCSSPTYVINRLEFGNLLLSPFLIKIWHMPSILMFAWNALLLGLLEESITQMLGSTLAFAQLLFGVMVSVGTLRQVLGYVFSKSTGYALPSLFFSDALHECNQGFAPFLFALLVIQALNINDRYVLMYGNDKKFMIRKVTLQTLMCLLNYTVRNILWWTISSLFTGLIALVFVRVCLFRHKNSNIQWFDNDEEISLGGRRISFWRSSYISIRNGLSLVCCLVPVLLLFNSIYTREMFVDPTTLNQLSHDRYLFTFVIMTAPRRGGNPPFLTQTLASYIENWPAPELIEPGSVYDRMQIVVYTHFTNHSEFDSAHSLFSADPKGKHYIKWMREDGSTLNQRMHVSKALSRAADQFQSTYITLVEDDFPVCGPREWKQIERVVYQANQQVPSHCGVFVGTGGSGLFLKPKIAKLTSGLLLKYPTTPPDIVIQNCLLGTLNECKECSQTLVTSKTLLMYHIGFNTSTSIERNYKKNEYQCGWRHPFNGDPNVINL